MYLGNARMLFGVVVGLLLLCGRASTSRADEGQFCNGLGIRFGEVQDFHPDAGDGRFLCGRDGLLGPMRFMRIDIPSATLVNETTLNGPLLGYAKCGIASRAFGILGAQTYATLNVHPVPPAPFKSYVYRRDPLTATWGMVSLFLPEVRIAGACMTQNPAFLYIKEDDHLGVQDPMIEVFAPLVDPLLLAPIGSIPLPASEGQAPVCGDTEVWVPLNGADHAIARITAVPSVPVPFNFFSFATDFYYPTYPDKLWGGGGRLLSRLPDGGARAGEAPGDNALLFGNLLVPSAADQERGWVASAGPLGPTGPIPDSSIDRFVKVIRAGGSLFAFGHTYQDLNLVGFYPNTIGLLAPGSGSFTWWQSYTFMDGTAIVTDVWTDEEDGLVFVSGSDTPIHAEGNQDHSELFACPYEDEEDYSPGTGGGREDVLLSVLT